MRSVWNWHHTCIEHNPVRHASESIAVCVNAALVCISAYSPLKTRFLFYRVKERTKKAAELILYGCAETLQVSNSPGMIRSSSVYSSNAVVQSL